MKILHVITDIGAGGAETALCRLIETLKPPDYQHCVVVLNASGANGSQSRRVREAGATLVVLAVRPAAPNPLALLRLRRLVKRWTPDIVQGWMYHGNLAAALSCGPVALVWGIRQTLYAHNREKSLTWLVIRAGAWLSSRPAAIVYNSRLSSLQHESRGYRADRSRVIDNGIDVETFKPNARLRNCVREELGIPKQAFVLGHFAHWRAMKDHATAIEAAGQFVASVPDAIFVFAGDAMDAGNRDLTGLIEARGLAGHVRLCGRRTDMHRVMAAVDLGYSSSAWGEAFSNAIAETMACGAPCVATDVGAAREIVGDCGFVVPPRDPAALCNAWRAIRDLDSDARQTLSQRARARIAARYSLRACGENYAMLYGEIRGRSGRVAGDARSAPRLLAEVDGGDG